MDVTLVCDDKVRSDRSKMAAQLPNGRRVSRPAPRYSPGDYTLEEEVTPVRRGGERRRGPLLVGGAIETPNRRGGQRRGRGRGRYQPVVVLVGDGEENDDSGRDDEENDNSGSDYEDNEVNNNVSEAEEVDDENNEVSEDGDSDNSDRDTGDRDRTVQGGDVEQVVQPALLPAAAAVPPPAVPAQRRQVRQVAGLHGGEQVALADRLDPVVPGPHPGPVVEDAAGRNRIDMWGVWQCMLCE